MPGQIHRVVENAHDFDHLTGGGGVHDEMPAASALAGDVQAAQAGLDFIALLPWTSGPACNAASAFVSVV